MAGFRWGGSEELWSRAAVWLRLRSHSVAASVAGWSRLSSRVTELRKQGIDLYVRRRMAGNLFSRVIGKVMRGQEYRWLQRQAGHLVVISQGGSMDGLEWMRFCYQAGLPYVVIVQCNAEQSYPENEFAVDMAKLYAAARKVFCVSRHNLACLERQIGMALPKGMVVWNPFNVNPDLMPAWPANGDRWKLACVARLETAAKGQDLLLQVLARPQWRERSVEVNLYGVGPNEFALRRLAEYLELQNVNFRGQVADIAAVWRHNHLLVLPSRFEGTPLALVESMWCGRPAVVTDIGGNAEVCQDGGTGFVAAAPSVKILEETMERAWERRHEWQAMGQAARAHVEGCIPKDPVSDFCRQLLDCIS